jgi:FKBP-type peptidyl-prolyl cis-trans isomerase
MISLAARRVGILLGGALALGCSKGVPEPGKSDFTPASGQDPPPQSSSQAPAANNEPSGPARLLTEDVVVGTGKTASNGDTLSVNYTGTLMSGKKFDSSLDRGSPFEFRLGVGAVIKGWDQGIVGMKVGGKRKLTIPSQLAYGERGHPPTIPPGAALKFDIELLAIK